MPLRTIDLNQALSGSEKAVLDQVRADSLAESAYETKVIKHQLPERIRFTVGTINNRVDFINSEKKGGVSPWVAVSGDCKQLHENIVFMQEAYLREALSFALKNTETTKEEWTLIRPFAVSDKPVYLNHDKIHDNVCIFSAERPFFATNNNNYTGAGMMTLSPRLSMDEKTCTIRFKLFVKTAALYEGREVDNFSDELFDIDLPEGVSMPTTDRAPSKRRRT
tara:strand:+ start:1387 stop:2052 length:666 start_codon:yes stop_codon:yes gene_type:complete